MIVPAYIRGPDRSIGTGVVSTAPTPSTPIFRGGAGSSNVGGNVVTRESNLVPCTHCERRFDDLVGKVIGKGVGKVPGHSVGSNWDWVPCPAGGGTREVEARDE